MPTAAGPSCAARCLIGADGIHSGNPRPDVPRRSRRAMGRRDHVAGGRSGRNRCAPAPPFVGAWHAPGTGWWIYPISEPDAEGLRAHQLELPRSKLSTPSHGWQQRGGSALSRSPISRIISRGFPLRTGWMCPRCWRRADCAYENPMIDREPLSTWVDGLVSPLMGDAAHAMYPTGFERGEPGDRENRRPPNDRGKWMLGPIGVTPGGGWRPMTRRSARAGFAMCRCATAGRGPSAF